MAECTDKKFTLKKPKSNQPNKPNDKQPNKTQHTDIMQNILVEQKIKFQAGNGWCNCNTFIDEHVDDNPEIHVKRVVFIIDSHNTFYFKNYKTIKQIRRKFLQNKEYAYACIHSVVKAATL